MNLIGKDVVHEKFGKGKVVSLDDNRIEVEFDSATKKFIYPEVFNKFMNFKDKSAQKFIDKVLVEVNKQKRIEIEQKHKEAELLEKIHTLKVHPNSQAAFGFIENDLDSILETGTIFTGRYLSGASKGEPRIPQRLNINTACLLTAVPEGATEEERLIIGVFMVDDEFNGKECTDGIIPAHETYRIMLDPESERMVFWDYFSTDAKRKKWGNCEIKYLSNINMQEILIHMVKNIKDKDRKEQAKDFYDYFCSINRLEPVAKSS